MATATITLADGTRILTRGTGLSRKNAERAAALLLCEHPGVCVHLQQPHRLGRAKTKAGGRHPPVDSHMHTEEPDRRNSVEAAQSVTTAVAHKNAVSSPFALSILFVKHWAE